MPPEHPNATIDLPAASNGGLRLEEARREMLAFADAASERFELLYARARRAAVARGIRLRARRRVRTNAR